MHRVFKSSGTSDDEIQAMRTALTDANIEFTEHAQSILGGGQAGLWVNNRKTKRQARQVINIVQKAWVEYVRSDPQSVQAPNIFGSNKPLVWCTCIIVFLLHIVLISELFFGW